MVLDLNAVGKSTAPQLVSWDTRDTLLYALSVGAGQADAVQELSYTTENSEGHPQRVLPTFGGIITDFLAGEWIDLGEYDEEMLVHAEQRLEVLGELPVAGQAEVTTTIDGIYDKGSGALVVSTSTARDPQTGAELVRSRASQFIRGEGGFGIAGPREVWDRPERRPDRQFIVRTRHDQALLYRLTGDRNPLHSDPAFAARAGFSRPILHGMCSYGVTARVLLHAYCDGEAADFLSLDVRFSSPVYPGDVLFIDVWEGDAGEHRFIVRRNETEVVLDRGRFAFTA